MQESVKVKEKAEGSFTHQKSLSILLETFTFRSSFVDLGGHHLTSRLSRDTVEFKIHVKGHVSPPSHSVLSLSRQRPGLHVVETGCYMRS